jgi:hypothetical protein
VVGHPVRDSDSSVTFAGETLAAKAAVGDDTSPAEN